MIALITGADPPPFGYGTGGLAGLVSCAFLPESSLMGGAQERLMDLG